MDWIQTFFNDLPLWAPKFAQAAGNTALISVLGFGLASVLGVVIALMLMGRRQGLRMAAKLYIGFFRGVPLLVILFLLYFGLPGIGIVFDAIPCAVIGLGLCFAAQMAEVVRAGFLAVPRGQAEAAAAVGMTPVQTFGLILVPQVMRISAAPIIVTFVSLLKDSSLASLITVKELALTGRALSTEFFLPLQIFVWIGLIYFAMAFPLSMLARRLARRAIAPVR